MKTAAKLLLASAFGLLLAQPLSAQPMGGMGHMGHAGMH